MAFYPKEKQAYDGLHLRSEDNSMSIYPPKFKTPGDMDYQLIPIVSAQ